MEFGGSENDPSGGWGGGDGGSGIGLDHSGPARGRGRGRGFGADPYGEFGFGVGRGQAQGFNADPYGEFGFQGMQGRGLSPGNTQGQSLAGGQTQSNTVDPGLAAAMADIMASRGRNRGYRAGNPHTDVLNPDVAQATGWAPGKAMLDRYGQPVTLDNLSFTRDDLLNDENYAAWAKQNPDKVRNTPGMLGGLLNSLGLHDLTGAMTPEENAFADSRWGDPSMGAGGNSPAGGDIFPQGGRPNATNVNVGGPGGWQGIPPQLIRQLMQQRALSQEGGDNYDGRYDRRNPRTYESGFEGGDQPD